MSELPTPPALPVTVPIKLNRGQQKAYSSICEFLSPLQTEKRFLRLSGYAGTGKTFLLRSLIFNLPRLSAVACAPTNQATKVIKKTLASSGIHLPCKTIYSLLGIKMVSDEDRMILEFPTFPVDLSGYDVVYVDESSMLNRELLAYIKSIIHRSRTKWVFLGDKAQIPPVGERNSPIWKLDCVSLYLTHVERYDNQILELATHIRQQVTSYPNIDLRLRSHHDEKQGVWKFRREKFLENFRRVAARGEFSVPGSVAAVAWRNRTVDEMNAVARHAIFGDRAYKSQWIVGDRITMDEPLMFEGRQLAHIGDEGTVLSSEVVHHTIYKDVKVYYLVVQIDDGDTINLHVIHEDYAAALQLHLNALAIAAKADRSQWRYFWVMRNAFHRVRHAYAKTAHRIQGSTFTTVFVDTVDILANSNTREALRCLYVAATRPTTFLILT